MSIVPLNIGSAPNDGTGQDLRSGGQVINANFAELDQRTAAAQSTADGKVDKQVGKGLSTEDFTTGEKNKLAGLQPGHYRGTFVTLAALQAGVTTPVAGDYADVDAGVGSDVQRYIWDATDSKWVLQGASGGGPDNTDSLPEGSTNRYFTAARVLGVALSGLSLLTGTAILATDSVLVAFGKLQKQLTDLSTAIANKANKGANSDITSLSGLITPLSVSQGGNGAIAPTVITDANVALNNGRYATAAAGWVGQVFPGVDARNDGYLTHDNYGENFAIQTWRSIVDSVEQCVRWKYAGTWGAWTTPRAAWGTVTGTLSNQTDLKAALDGKLGSTQADFAIVYPNGGSAANPATIATNARYITDNPFPGFHVIVQIDLLVGGVWSDPGWDGNTGTGGSTYGAIAAQSLPSDKVIVQTGTSSVATASNLLGGGHGTTSTTPTTSAPCRVKVWKLKGAVT